ncbi:hypothetical protein SPRG_13061 [Saprolegnia parasitica CBS 223.65]|uniref:Uncharacterized protein n=1 Tax=Saprolegnia parasitica (strain CBS 223.65) TaxID=695850 RepID=A0A067BSZ5_SAPPC|nr:hypothetical protein SPRG_13061 [Saprolegnia parasitica CBS 223.65]KDO19955.1 hypothetical protein SPRG_13061 [Saprolegnia parasitica CBS 223.65]|eukprot:XP_012209326.1 hypothetical protein SPRG_13061 [Saprolegnia parasitica CBS 223.65]
MESKPLLHGGRRLSASRPPMAGGSRHALWVSWLTPLLYLGQARPLEMDDLCSLDPASRAHVIALHFKQQWGPEKRRVQPRVWLCLLKAFGRPFFLAGCMKLLADVLQFVVPMVLAALLHFMASSAPMAQGYMYVGILFGVGLAQSVFLRQYFCYCADVGLYVKSALVATTYDKALHLALSVRQQTTSASILRLVTTDVQKLHDAPPYLHALWYATLQICMATYLLYSLVGVATFAGIAIAVIMTPLSSCLVSKATSAHAKLHTLAAARQHTCDETLRGLKMIKMQTWEEHCLARLTTLREAELTQMALVGRLRSLSTTLFDATPLLMAMAVLGVHVYLTGAALDLATVLPCLLLLQMLRTPIALLPQVFSTLSEASASLRRITAFLIEVDQRRLTVGTLSAIGVRFEDADLSWQLPSPDASEASFSSASNGLWQMRGIDLYVRAGELCAILGPRNSGKSTLLNALLNEVHCTSGRVMARGAFAYVAQKPFLRHTSIKENVLFGKPWEASWYACVMDVTGLTSLVLDNSALFPDHDETNMDSIPASVDPSLHVRIALARAVYQNADVYLLDDIFASMDTATRDYIFGRCLRGLLRRKCILWVTDALAFVPLCDSVVLLEDGVVVEQGSITTVLSDDGPIHDLLQAHAPLEDATTRLEAAPTGQDFVSPDPTPLLPTLTDAVASLTKHSGVYKRYVQACGGYGLAATTLVWYLSAQATTVLATLYLGFDDSLLGLYVFATGHALYIGLLYMRSAISYRRGRVGSQRLFHTALWRLLRAPLSFFETSPVSALISTLASDMAIVDLEVPSTMHMLLHTLLFIATSIGLVVLVAPWFALAVLPAMASLYALQRAYVPSANGLQRLEAATREAMTAYVRECLLGLRSLHAYRIESHCSANYYALLDAHQRVHMVVTATNHWLAVRVEWLGATLSALAAALVVYSKASDMAPLPLVAMALYYALQLPPTLHWALRVLAQVQASHASLQRLESCDNLPMEAPLTSDLLPRILENEKRGRLTFENVQVRYQPHQAPALTHLSFDVAAHEKISVVGASGSGKSSLVIALLRLLELDAGVIRVDGVDIASMGLHDARRQVAYIPQDPILFSGSVRSNLDPFGVFGDDRLWAALRRAQLVSMVGSLDEPVTERGRNFTVIERQLLCCARIWLKNAAIVCLDEPAAASWATPKDYALQEAVRAECADRTVLTVTHRLNTILTSDRVLVLEHGRMAALGTPAEVLAAPCATMATLLEQWRAAQPMT